MQIHQYREALRLIQQSGLTNHAIGNLLKMSPNTIQRCRLMTQQHGWSWEMVQQLDDKELATCLKLRRNVSNNKAMPDWPVIHPLIKNPHGLLYQ